MLLKNVITYYLQNFKIFLRSKSEHDREQKGSSPTPVDSLPPQQKASYNKLVEQLANIDQVKKFSSFKANTVWVTLKELIDYSSFRNQL